MWYLPVKSQFCVMIWWKISSWYIFKKLIWKLFKKTFNCEQQFVLLAAVCRRDFTITNTRWKMAEHLGIFCRMNARVRFTSGAALCGQMNQKINFLKNKISCLYTRSLINSSCAWTVDWISPRVCRRINSSAKCAAISAGAEGELLSLSQSRSLHNFIQEVSEWVSEWQKPPRCCSLSHISVHDWLTFTEGNAIMWKIRWEECVGWWAGSEAPALSGYHIPQSASYFRPPSSSIRSFPTCTKRPSSNTHGLMWLSSQPFGV